MARLAGRAGLVGVVVFAAEGFPFGGIPPREYSDSAQMPDFGAFQEERALPSAEAGPVPRCAFVRLAWT
jgi:hypothetical protein